MRCTVAVTNRSLNIPDDDYAPRKFGLTFLFMTMFQGTRFVYPWKAMVCNIATQAAQNAANGAGLVGPAKDQMHAHFNKPDQNFHVDSVFLPYSTFRTKS